MLNRLGRVFKSLHDHDVRYVVIDGVAAIVHGIPRSTFDLDILVGATRDNVQRLLDGLVHAGIGTAALTTCERVLAYEITVFKDWVRIDVQTWTPGLAVQTAWENKLTLEHEGQMFYVVARDDLIAAKRAAGRPVDLEDVRLLELARAGDTEQHAAPNPRLSEPNGSHDT